MLVLHIFDLHDTVYKDKTKHFLLIICFQIRGNLLMLLNSGDISRILCFVTLFCKRTFHKIATTSSLNWHSL